VRVLVTNDDGVMAPGLAHLARGLLQSGHDLTIAAPLQESSGAGAGVGPIHTMGAGVVVKRVQLPGLEGVATYGVEALPALIVIAACVGAFGPTPDLVVSGINPGRNVGRAALHSGTVGAALTSVHFNKRGLAMSIQSGVFSGFESAGGGLIHFETAAVIAVTLVPVIAAAPARTVVNCNVPNLPVDRLRGIRLARLSRTGLIRSAAMDEAADMRMQLELGFAPPAPDDETDEALSTRGYVTLTPLASVAEDDRDDVGDVIGSGIRLAAGALGIAHVDEAAERDGPAA
jgi:5'-nucleotidase